MNKGLVASIIFAAGAFALFVLVWPQLDSIGSAREALKLRQALLAERQAELKKVEELDRQYKARQADIDRITAFMPEQKRVDSIVSSILQIASQTGLNLAGITTAAAAEVGGALGYKKVFVGFDVVGQYPSFVNFLKLLEQNLRLYDIYEIIGSMTSKAGPGSQALVNFSVKLNAYNLK